MIRIHIRSKDLKTPVSAVVQSGTALLIGRAPDPSRIDWTAISRNGPPAATPPSRLQTIAVESSRASANHLLVLKDGRETSLYDLGSRNGSWLKLEPRTPVVLSDSEASVDLARAPVQESRIHRPHDAEWTCDEEFDNAVVRALTEWLASFEAPVQLIVRPAGYCAAGIVLAGGSVVELQECGTMPVPSAEIFESVRSYVYEQNTRFFQIRRRVSGMVAASPALQNILLRTAEAAASGRRLILLGPTGVGKELLARSYHGYSARHAGPFVTVNCALLQSELLYAQLFGARRGAFTGAVADIPGFIDIANGGTLFLDELGEMSSDVQKALLRFLDSRGEYQRLGDPKTRRADVQIVCASNTPLDDPDYRVTRFRDDLWYRLASAVLRVPPLCERSEDVRAFLYSQTLEGSSLTLAEALTEDALALVLQDPWPGNFRDLVNFSERLPRVTKPASIDRAICQKALAEGRRPISSPHPIVAVTPASNGPAVAPAPQRTAEPATRGSGKGGRDAALPNNSAIGWAEIVQRSLSEFLEDHAAQTAGWDQLHLLIERYLKPVYVAHAAQLTDTLPSSRGRNYSALARKLHIADGSTVKTHLTRFEERFAKPCDSATEARPVQRLSETGATGDGFI